MILNRQQIMEIIPHRAPFLLLDDVLELEPGKRCVAEKHVVKEDFWVPGHFPEHAVMPGVLIVEALAQTGAEGKLARYLLSSGEPSVHAPATDLAKRLGLSRASLYRAFEALETAGLIRRECKTVFVLDRGGLEGVL